MKLSKIFLSETTRPRAFIFGIYRVPTVREKSGNFEIGQGNLKNKQKSGKSQGIL